MAVFVGVTGVALPLIGIGATGIAFVGIYALYLPTVFLLAWRKTGFAWQRRVYMQLVLLCGLGLVVISIAWQSQGLGALAGTVLATLLGLQALARLRRIADLGSSVARVAGFVRRFRK